MKPSIKSFFFATLFTCALPTSADEIEASLGSNMVDFRHSGEIQEKFLGKLAFMYSKDDEGANNTDITSNMISLALATQGERSHINIRLGGRVFLMYMDVDSPVNDSGSGFGLGLGAGISAPIIPDLSASLDSYFAPDLLTIGDVDSTWDTEIRLNYQIIENGNLFVGYRILRGELNGSNGDVFNGGLLGLRLAF